MSKNEHLSDLLKSFQSDILNMLDEMETECFKEIVKRDYKKLALKQRPYVQRLYNQYQNLLNLKLRDTKEFGLNFVFDGVTGNYYFPAIVFYSYKSIKHKITTLDTSSFKSFLDLEVALSIIVSFKRDNRKKGLSIDLIESLRYIMSNFTGFTRSDNIINSQYLIREYRPLYKEELSLSDLKRHSSKIDNLVGEYIIPINLFWNIGSFILDESMDIGNFHLPVFPYWSLYNNNRPFLTLHRISTQYIQRKFNWKKQLIKSFTYFINFNYYSLYGNKRKLYQFTQPDLFQCYDQFEGQNFEYFSQTSFNRQNKSILSPNWILTVPSPQRPVDVLDILLKDESDQINEFLIQHLDTIIHLFNTNRINRFNVNLIMHSNKINNIFENIFTKRLRLSDWSLNYELVIYFKNMKEREAKHFMRLKKFLVAIYPAGIVLEFNSGFILYFLTKKENIKNDIVKLKEFIDMFSRDYFILDNPINHGFLIYFLPPSTNFVDNNWNFPEISLQIQPREFKNIHANVIKKEHEYLNNDMNKRKIREFIRFINSISTVRIE